jgi:antitoxin ParD1/3/4
MGAKGRERNVIMPTVKISLSEELKEFVDGQVGSGRYSSVSDYVGELIRDDEKRKAQGRLEALLMEGLESGEATDMTEQDCDDIREEADRVFEARRSQKTA